MLRNTIIIRNHLIALILINVLFGCTSLNHNQLCIARDSLDVYLDESLVIGAQDCSGNRHEWRVDQPTAVDTVTL